MSDTITPTPEAAPVATPELQPGQAAPPADGGVVDASTQPVDPSAAPQEPEPQQPKQPSRFDRRISDLTRSERLAKEEAAYWRGVAEAKAQNGAQPPAQNPPAQEGGEPDPANYPAGEFDGQYIRDLARFTAREERKALDKEAAETRAFEEAKERFVSAHDACLDAGYEQGADFLRDLGRTPALADSIAESASPPIAAEYFARNPREWAEVARLTPTRRAVEIDRIVHAVSAKLKASQPTTQPAPQAQPAHNGAPAAQPAALQATPTVNGRYAEPAFDPNKAPLADYEAMLARLRGGGAQ